MLPGTGLFTGVVLPTRGAEQAWTGAAASNLPQTSAVTPDGGPLFHTVNTVITAHADAIYGRHGRKVVPD